MDRARNTPALFSKTWLPRALVCLATLSFFVDTAQAQVGPPVTPRFPNVTQTPGTLLSGLNAPQQGRTAILAYHNGVLYTVPEVPSSQPGADFQVRSWDLQNLMTSGVVETGAYGTTPMPINAHGYFKSGDYLVLGSNWPPEAPWSFRANGSASNQRTEFPGLMCAGTRGCLYAPWFVDRTYWSYDAVSGNATLARNWVEIANWDHLGLTGVVGHPFLLGDLLIYASDQSRTGVATYDLSDRSNPVLLDVLTDGGAGGYWPELFGHDGRLYAVFPYRTGGNGIRVVDVTDPSDLRFVTDRTFPGDEMMYVQFQDEYAFTGGHKIDMRTYESVLFLDGANAVRPSDGGTGVDTSQFLLPLGNLVVSGGIGPNEGMAIWAHQATPDTRGPEVAYHRPQAGRSHYPVDAPISLLIHETLETTTIINGQTFLVRPLGGSAIDGELIFSFGDILTFTPDQNLQADTTYEVVIPDGGIKDAAGNGIVGTSFTFSTGATVSGNGAPSVTSFDATSPALPGETVSISATAQDPESGALEFRFDFGDGSAKTAWSSGTSTDTSYPSPGHYRASVQVRDPAGALATSTRIVTVVTPPAGPEPRNSSSVVCDEGARTVFAVNPDNDSVTAVHADSLSKDLEVPVCDDPRSIALGGGEAWVSCHDDDTLRVLDEQSGALLATLDTGYGSAPAGIVLSPDETTVYVALESSGELLRLDRATRTEIGRLALGDTPRALAMSGDGSFLLVTRFLSPRNHAEVWRVATSSFTLASTLVIPKFGENENIDSTASGRGVANYLVGITISPDGEIAWVAATKPNTERGLLIHDDLDSDNTVRTVVAQLDLSSGGFVRAIDLDNSDSASAIAFSPLGDYLLVTLQGNNDVVVLDALELDGAAGLGSLVTRVATGAAPQGLCIDPSTGRTFVKNLLSRDLSVLETGTLFGQGTATVSSQIVPTVASESLDPQVLLGKQIFYDASPPRMSAEGYLSCATCHLDGGHDGRLWDFTGRGEGLRNTTTLRGRAGTAHGNVHWSANFDEIQDFENDIRGAFGGSGFLSDVDFDATSAPLGLPKAGLSVELDALAAYVTSLGTSHLPRSPFRTVAGAMTGQGEAGRTVFQSLGCASCHGGPGFTDSTLGTELLHDTGTLRTTSGQRLGGPLQGIDTPTLLGVWATAPYFHDGSAESLEDVLVVAGGQVIPGESASVSNGANIVDQWTYYNNDDTVRGEALAEVGASGGRITFYNVDGGSGGTGAIEVRHSNGNPRQLLVRVNGVLHTTTLADVGNDPQWRHTNWQSTRLEGVQLAPGTSNTIELTNSDGWPNISIDEIVVSTADDLEAALPHRSALVLSASDRSDLLAFLRQLDGTPEANAAPSLFADTFEAGNVGLWSRTVD